jgi:hypothetical protein
VAGTDEAGALVPDTAGLPHARLRPADAAALEQLVAAWRAWWVDLVGRPHGQYSSASSRYAIDVVTGEARELPSNGQRDYSAATPTEICGTVDLSPYATRRRELIVLDYKTGFGSHRYRDHEEQMRFLGGRRARVA